MFCPNCGANLPDSAGFCSECGNRIPTAQPAQPAYQQPAAQPVYQQPAYGQPAMSKGDYLKTQASPNTKLMVKIAWGLMALCLLIVGLGLNSCLNGPFYDIPVVRLAMGDDYDEAVEELDYIKDMGDDFADIYEDEIPDKDLDKLIKLSLKWAENPSLNNTKKIGTLMYKYDIEGLSKSDLDLFSGVITAIWIAFLIVMALTVLGGVLKNIIPLIIAAVLSLPVNLIFSGVLFAILTLAGLIALVVVLTKINGEYNNYKRSSMPVYGY